MNFSNLFSDEKVNTGRQVELDIAKALSIIFMVFLHTMWVVMNYNHLFSPNYEFIVGNVLGRPYAAPIFMFCMGVGMVYSRNSQWDKMIKRGIILYLLGILVNVFEFFIPHFVSGTLLGNWDAFPIFGGLLLFCVDILAFAGLAFISMGIFKKFEFSNKKLVVIAVALSIIGSFSGGTDFGVPLINLFFANFIGTAGGYTAFPLFNWLIFPIAGYIWGQYFIRAKDKNDFFRFWPIFIIIALIYFFVSTDLWGGILSVEDIHLYYFMNTLDAVFCIINAHGVIGLCYWIAKYLPDEVIKAFTILSSNINTIYIAQWFFVPLTGIFIAYFFKDLVINDFLNSIISICMIVLATAVALGYRKLRST
jgi:uncharacterized membrane protein